MEIQLPWLQIIISLFFSILIFLKIRTKLKTKKSIQNFPPGPWKLPVLGNMHNLVGAVPHRALHQLAIKFGPVIGLKLGELSVVVVSSPDAAKQVMKTHDINFASRPSIIVSEIISYGCTSITFGPYGDYWRQMKSILVQQLLSSKRVQSFSSIMEEETGLFVRKIGESSGMVNLSEMFGEFANDVICRSAFGEKFRESVKGKKLVKLLAEFMVLFGDICVGDFIPWLSWIDRVRGFDKKLDVAAKAMDEFLEDAIQERIDVSKGCEKNGENFIDNMLKMFILHLLYQ